MIRDSNPTWMLLVGFYLVFVIGWVFFAIAVSFFLSRLLAWEAAIAIVGLAHILTGAVLARGAVRTFNATRRIITVDMADPVAAQVLRG